MDSQQSANNQTNRSDNDAGNNSTYINRHPSGIKLSPENEATSTSLWTEAKNALASSSPHVNTISPFSLHHMIWSCRLCPNTIEARLTDLVTYWVWPETETLVSFILTPSNEWVGVDFFTSRKNQTISAKVFGGGAGGKSITEILAACFKAWVKDQRSSPSGRWKEVTVEVGWVAGDKAALSWSIERNLRAVEASEDKEEDVEMTDEQESQSGV